jgi:uncharacterized protein YcbK (DUF882 family)
MINLKYVDDFFNNRVFNNAASVPMDQWRWDNFTPAELACKGTGRVLVDTNALDKLQNLRFVLCRPIVLNSAYRSKKHNTAQGGAKGSFHLTARAYDAKILNHDPVEYVQAAKDVGFGGIGYYGPEKYHGNAFIHVDTGPNRTWGKPWTIDAAPDVEPEAETPPPAPFKMVRGRFGRLVRQAGS